jgi:hypothetical protein
MQLDEGQLRAAPDGGTLYSLPSGIEIIRRMKHEPIETEGLTREELERLTDKVSGSKFLGGMTLADIVRMTEEVLRENGASPGSGKVYNRAYDKPIGISRGRRVRRLRVVLNGRWAHGYPVQE